MLRIMGRSVERKGKAMKAAQPYSSRGAYPVAIIHVV